jgi:DNA polymerase I
MGIPKASPEAIQLFHEGALALAQVEANGLRIDTEYVQTTKKELVQKQRVLEEELREDPVFKVWKREYGPEAKLTSGPQLAHVLFEKLGYEPKAFTENNAAKTDVAGLDHIDLAFVKKLIQFKKLNKCGDFLHGIESETVDGYLHPHQHLNIPQSYRSSSTNPNAHNWPTRDKEMAKFIRSCFIPRGKKRRILEIDFKGAEVVVSACYHKDPVFISYITDPSKDMHRDMAAQLYMLPTDKVSKESRHAAKNKFVFPQFYGDYYLACAQFLWEEIDKQKLNVDGVPLKKHLKSKGITRLGELDSNIDPEKGTFVYHVKKTEEDFWGRRFRVYNSWKASWWQTYLEQGYCRFYTGFVMSGPYNRKQVINYPVQGASFHCLLWCLIQLNKWLKKNNMKSLIIGQIHDSIIMDILDSEMDAILEFCHKLMTVTLAKHYTWLTVPMSIEAEVAPIGASWFYKEPVHFESAA